MNESGRTRPDSRYTIPATCCTHGGPVGFTNLQLRREAGRIVLDPHVTGECVISLDEAGATELHRLLASWLGWTGQ
jgi:hypothetical protein